MQEWIKRRGGRGEAEAVEIAENGSSGLRGLEHFRGDAYRFAQVPRWVHSIRKGERDVLRLRAQ